MDPIRLQNQLLATKERADELHEQLEHMSRLVAPLLVHHSMVRHYDQELSILRAAVVSLGVDLPVLGPVDGAVRSVAAGRLTANEEG